MNKKTIVKQLLKAKDSYYNGKVTSISDIEFDELEDKLRSIDPKNEYFNKVGSRVYGNKVKHSIPMKSMQKCNKAEELKKWISKTGNNKYIITPKIDGLSVSVKYKDGKLFQVATRGDGKEGQDITEHARYIRDIPHIIKFKEAIEFRGEIHLPKNTEYNTNGSPLRNVATGLINSKSNMEKCRYLKVLFYNMIHNESNFPTDEYTKILSIQNMGFNIPDLFSVENMEGIKLVYNDYVKARRKAINYEIDGLVITINSIENQNDFANENAHHNDFNIAWKFPNEEKKTIIKDIEWNVSRQGNLIPVAVFNEVVIGDTKMSRATLSNYENVVALNISKGDKLLVARANDVIPMIASNIDKDNHEEANDLLPDVCPSCKSKLGVKGVHLYCSNKKCSSRIIQSILHWVEKTKMEGISEGIITILYESKIVNSILDLYELEENRTQIIAVPGLGEKKYNNIISEVNKTRELFIDTFIAALGIDLVGIRAVNKLKINTLNDFIHFKDTKYAIGRNIIEWLKDADNMHTVIKLVKKITLSSTKDYVHKGKIAMTGKAPISRKELTKKLEKAGYEVSKSITKDTAVLLVEDINSNSSKLQKARKLGIKIIEYNIFMSE